MLLPLHKMDYCLENQPPGKATPTPLAVICPINYAGLWFDPQQLEIEAKVIEVVVSIVVLSRGSVLVQRSTLLFECLSPKK